MNPEELLNKQNIQFRYSGGDLLIRCLNPEHEDRNPSLRVDKITGKFNCFSCGFSGSLFVHFNEEQNIINVRVQNLKTKINKLSTQKLHIPLSAEPFIKDYRGISAETFKHFEAFTDPNNKIFDGRIIFPIRDINDDILILHSRYLHSELKPKYYNYPENVSLPLYPASPDIINGSIILVEGSFDMINLWDKGLTNAVCIFGANIVSKKDREYTQAIKRFAQYKLQGVNKIYTCLDGDEAGRQGAKSIEKALGSTYIIKNIELADGTDPGSLNYEDVQSIKEYLYGTKDSNN